MIAGAAGGASTNENRPLSQKINFDSNWWCASSWGSESSFPPLRVREREADIPRSLWEECKEVAHGRKWNQRLYWLLWCKAVGLRGCEPKCDRMLQLETTKYKENRNCGVVESRSSDSWLDPPENHIISSTLIQVVILRVNNVAAVWWKRSKFLQVHFSYTHTRWTSICFL